MCGSPVPAYRLGTTVSDTSRVAVNLVGGAYREITTLTLNNNKIWRANQWPERKLAGRLLHERTRRNTVPTFTNVSEPGAAAALAARADSRRARKVVSEPVSMARWVAGSAARVSRRHNYEYPNTNRPQQAGDRNNGRPGPSPADYRPAPHTLGYIVHMALLTERRHQRPDCYGLGDGPGCHARIGIAHVEGWIEDVFVHILYALI
jgi:hypothetical protein